jgi:YD repeat-containing protein
VVVEELRYDALGRVASVKTAEGARTYRYDLNGRIAQMTTPQGTVKYQWDAAGRLVGQTIDDTGAGVLSAALVAVSVAAIIAVQALGSRLARHDR